MTPIILPLSGDEIAIRTHNTAHFISGDDALHALLHGQIRRQERSRVRQDSATQELEPVESAPPQIPSLRRWLDRLFRRKPVMSDRDRRVLDVANRNLREMGR